MRVSYSDLETYKLCPRKFKFKRERAPYDDSGDLPLRFGSAVHNALKSAYSNTLVAPQLDQIMAAYYQSWPEAAKKDADIIVKETFLRGITAIKDYVQQNPPHKTHIAAVEKPIRLNFAGHTVVGRFDRVDVLEEGYFEVLDYKTGKMPTATNLAENWQLAIYQQAVGEMFQVPRVRTSLVYIMFGGHKLSHEFAQDELAQIKFDIIEVINEIARDEVFHPKPGGYCNRCGYAAICPAMRHQKLRTLAGAGAAGQSFTLVLPGEGGEQAGDVKEGPPVTVNIQAVIDEFISLRDQIQQLEQKLAQQRLIIAEYMAKENLTRLFSDLGEVNQAVSKVTTYDAAAVAAILQSTPYWQEVLSVSTSKLKAVLPQLTLEQRQGIAAATTVTEKAQLRVKSGSRSAAA